MSSSNYSKCLSSTLKWEGGYVNHPRDPGGATNRGVTQARYDEYRKDSGLSTRHVKQLTESELQAIYRRYYWNVIRGDELPAGVDLVVFDYAVNSGPSRAAKHLQEILGVSQDGVIGSATLNAVFSAYPDTIVNRLCDRRQKFVRGLSIYSTFGKGWENRIRDIRKVALSMTSTNVPADDPKTTVPINQVNFIESIIRWLVSFLKF